jgi:hypothetical protein
MDALTRKSIEMNSIVPPQDGLASLANYYLSDKGTGHRCGHGYTRIYSHLLAPVRTVPLRMLEIGLVHLLDQSDPAISPDQLGCPSLRMWSEYLPLAEIHGLDIVDFTRFSGGNIHVWNGDQGDRNFLAALGNKASGKFDLIIDDGSHASHHQQVSLATLFEFVADGGIYVIEDLHFQPIELEVSGITKTRDFLYNFRGMQGRISLAISPAELDSLARNIESIHFFDSISPLWPPTATADAIAVIQKKGSHATLTFPR